MSRNDMTKCILKFINNKSYIDYNEIKDYARYVLRHEKKSDLIITDEVICDLAVDSVLMLGFVYDYSLPSTTYVVNNKKLQEKLMYLA